MTLQLQRDFFRDSAQAYAVASYRDCNHSFPRLRTMAMAEALDGLSLRRSARILDAGCGPGVLLAEMTLRGFRCFGLDTSPEMLDLASQPPRANATRTPRANLVAGDVERLPYGEGSFDVVCSAGVIEYLSSDASILAESFRILRPGGHAILSATNTWSPRRASADLLVHLKRSPTFLKQTSRAWMWFTGRPVSRHPFRIRSHSPSKLCGALKEIGFSVIGVRYFYLLPIPHPLDRLIPCIASRLIDRFEHYAHTKLGLLAEGFLVICQKPFETLDGSMESPSRRVDGFDFAPDSVEVLAAQPATRNYSGRRLAGS